MLLFRVARRLGIMLAVAPAESCRDCGKVITGRARADVWQGELILCSGCYRDRKNHQKFLKRIPELTAALTGWPDKLWLVRNGREELGPFTTSQLTDLLKKRRVDWNWNIWREGMKAWTPAARLFTMPELDRGREIQLREFISPRPYFPRSKIQKRRWWLTLFEKFFLAKRRHRG